MSILVIFRMDAHKKYRSYAHPFLTDVFASKRQIKYEHVYSFSSKGYKNRKRHFMDYRDA